MNYEPPEVNIHEGYEPPKRTTAPEGQSAGKLKVIIVLLSCILVVQAVSLGFSIFQPRMSRPTTFGIAGAPGLQQNGQNAPTTPGQSSDSGSTQE
jgi:hypothetical protein